MFTSYHYCELVLTATPKGILDAAPKPDLEPANAAPAKLAFITVEDGDLHLKLEGGDPSATEGHNFREGSRFQLTGIQDLKNARFVALAGAPTKLKITLQR